MLSVRLDTLVPEPDGDLIDADDRCTGALGNCNGITQVVAMPVTEQNKIRLHRFRRDCRRGVSVQERIDNDFLPVCFEPGGSMSVPGKLQSHISLLFLTV